MKYRFAAFLFVTMILLGGAQYAQAASALPAFVRIGLVSGAAAVELHLPSGATLQDSAGQYVLQANEGGNTVTLSWDSGYVAGPSGSRSASFEARSVLGNLSLGAKPYRGSLIVQATVNGLAVINVVGFEDYLRGVLPCEVSPSWPMESLKAQAVAARTYALANLGKHGRSGFDLCSGVDCQVYGGAQVESATTDQAVGATRGVVAVFNGQPIAALYHSSSGGYTEDSATVWNWAVPYLKGVPDDDPSPYANWTRQVPEDEFQAALKAAGYDIGRVTALTPASAGSSGRAAQWVIAGETGSARLSGEQLRRILSLKSTFFVVSYRSPSVDGPLSLSTGVEAASGPGQAVVPAVAPIGTASFGDAPGAWVFYGHGWGHGVGMSQWGAMAMARGGHTYEEILQYYYQGISLVQWAEETPAENASQF